MLVVSNFFSKFLMLITKFLDYQVTRYENVWVSCSKLHLVLLSKNTWSSECAMFSVWNNTFSSSSLALYNSLFCRVPQTLLIFSKSFFCLALAMVDLTRSTCIDVHIQDDGSLNEALVGFLCFHLHPNKSFLFEPNGDIDIFCQLQFPITFGF